MLLVADPPPLGKMEAGGNIALSVHKASKIIGWRGKPSYLLLVAHWGWDRGRQAHTPYRPEWW